MFKSIFAKYFTVVSLIIMICFIAIGCVQLFLSVQFWVAEKHELLSERNNELALLASNTARQNNGGYDLSAITYDMDIISRTIGAYMFIVQHDGEIKVYSSNASEMLSGKSVSADFLSGVGMEYWEVGKLDGLFNSRYYTAGQPLVMQNGLVAGYVFTSSAADGLQDYMKENLRMFFFSAACILVIAFAAVYLLTYNMARPLRQMATAARRFGIGDFSIRINARGKDEVSELAMSLNSMAVSLSSAESMRRSFIANVSHELKTPMTTIAGFIDGILDGTIPPDKRSHYLSIVSAEIRRLSRLVKSMLDLTRIDNGELCTTPVKFDLTDVTCNVLLSFEPRIESKSISVNGLDDSPQVEVNADYDLIGQVVYNLIDNAIKFIDDGGTLTVRLFKKYGRSYFLVRNTGAGIPPDELPHIFERFYKSDKSRSLDKNGMGLGLYIVKTIITLHNGEIVVRSAEGEFCEFEFWLPPALPTALRD